MVARRVWAADLIAILLTTAVSSTIWFNADAVLGVFTTDPLVLELGKNVLFVEIFLGVGRALNIVMVRALIAVGDVKTPVTVNVVSSWIFAVGGGYLLGVGLGWGIVGMWIAMCVDEWLRAGYLVATFARGGWRRRAAAPASSSPLSEHASSPSPASGCMSGGERTLVAERDAGETFPRAPRLHMDESGRARIAEKKRDVAAPLEAERAGGIESAESEADGPDEPDRAPVAPPGIPPSAFACLLYTSPSPRD